MNIRRSIAFGIIALGIFSLAARANDRGLFGEINLSLLRMSGGGQIGLAGPDYFCPFCDTNYRYYDFDVTNDLSAGLDFGLGWKNRFLPGLKPLLGYRFSRQYSVTMAFDYKFRKKAEIYRGDGIIGTLNQSAYGQYSFQLAGQYYLTREVFFELGAEYIFIQLEDDYCSVFEGDSIPRYQNYEGHDDAWGPFVGIGWKRSLNRNLEFVARGMYFFARYEGTKLYQFIDSNLKLHIGGAAIQIGVRYNP